MPRRIYIIIDDIVMMMMMMMIMMIVNLHYKWTEGTTLHDHIGRSDSARFRAR